MTKAYRTPGETQDTQFARLERRVQELERAGAGLAYLEKRASASPAVTTSFVTVPGTPITIVRPGRYFVFWVCDFDWTVAGAAIAVGQVFAVGATAPVVSANFAGNSVGRATVAQSTFLKFTTAGSLDLQIAKTAAAGTCVCTGTFTVLTAIRTGPV